MARSRRRTRSARHHVDVNGTLTSGEKEAPGREQRQHKQHNDVDATLTGMEDAANTSARRRSAHNVNTSTTDTKTGRLPAWRRVRAHSRKRARESVGVGNEGERRPTPGLYTPNRTLRHVRVHASLFPNMTCGDSATTAGDANRLSSPKKGRDTRSGDCSDW